MGLLSPKPPKNKWSIVYERAIRDDGSLLFPERLTNEYLEEQRRTMGSFFFSNQYQNKILPDDEKKFKTPWLKYYDQLPEKTYKFAMIDPAIGQKNRNDYTGIAMVHTDSDGHWYANVLKRERMTPSQIVNAVFDMHEMFHLQGIGVESVAYQEALIYLITEEMKRRKVTVPLIEIKRSNQSKETRILSLTPRFEWGMISIARNQHDFEDEFNQFPRGAHDDILDALASIEEFVYYPQKVKQEIKKPPSPGHPDYERWFIQQLAKGQSTQLDNQTDY